MNPTPTPAIDITEVTVSYGDVVALDRASLRVPTGTVCGLIGMNGSGKSTLFKAIMGLLSPSHGSIAVHGSTPREIRQRGGVAYVPQSEEIDWSFPISVREVVMTGRYGRLGPTRRPRRSDRRAVDEAIDRVDLTGLADRQIGKLSGGQRKRAFVARGLAQEASVLLLDEPFAGVDKTTEATITSVLRESAAAGKTVLVSTHDLHALPDLADRAALLLRRILLVGTPQEVLEPNNLVRAFGVDPLGTADPVDEQGLRR